MEAKPDEKEKNLRLSEEEKLKGNECLLANDLQRAIKHYDTALKLNPLNHLVFGNRAQAYLNLKDYKNVILDSTSALELDPTFVKGFYRRAKAKEGLKDYLGAA